MKDTLITTAIIGSEYSLPDDYHNWKMNKEVDGGRNSIQVAALKLYDEILATANTRCLLETIDPIEDIIKISFTNK